MSSPTQEHLVEWVQEVARDVVKHSERLATLEANAVALSNDRIRCMSSHSKSIEEHSSRMAQISSILSEHINEYRIEQSKRDSSTRKFIAVVAAAAAILGGVLPKVWDSIAGLIVH